MRKVSNNSKKLKLLIKKECPNCKYIVETLKRIGVLDKIEVVEADDNVKAVPAIVDEDGEIDYVTGNLYGVIKIVAYLKKNKLL